MLMCTCVLCVSSVRQLFVRRQKEMSQDSFLRRLFSIRKVAHHRCNPVASNQPLAMYFCSLSPDTIVYKGMLTCEQLDRYFLDLSDPRFQSHVAVVHSRFSTNTFPAWSRAHPYRYLCHNGEISECSQRCHSNSRIYANATICLVTQTRSKETRTVCEHARSLSPSSATLPVKLRPVSKTSTFLEYARSSSIGGRTLSHSIMS